MMVGMASSTAGQGSHSPQPGSATSPLPPADADVDRVVVPLDGSPFAERALPVAAWAGGTLGVGTHLVEVVRSDEDAEGAIRYLDEVARRHNATSWDVVEQEDVPAALTEAVDRSPGGLTCMATHGRDRTAALLGSVAAALVDHSHEPVLLVGPTARPVTADDAPIVVAVDGTPRDDVLMSEALGWAGHLGRRLVIATVAEPGHGAADPEAYVAALVDRAAGSGIEIDTQVAHDPHNVRDGLVPILDRTAALVIIGSGTRHGEARTVLGSHAALIVHDTAVPALAVPVGDGVGA
jgi:nucleotide-binding universal stress UspA family protein